MERASQIPNSHLSNDNHRSIGEDLVKYSMWGGHFDMGISLIYQQRRIVFFFGLQANSRSVLVVCRIDEQPLYLGTTQDTGHVMQAPLCEIQT